MQFQLPKINYDDSDAFIFFYWDIRDASRRKSLYSFPGKITNLATRGRKCYNFETAKGRNLKFRTYMGHILIILSANFGGNRSRGTGFRAKN